MKNTRQNKCLKKDKPMHSEHSQRVKIATRNCPACGHHEVGYVTADGEFHPLKSGDAIGVFQESAAAGSTASIVETCADGHARRRTDPQERIAWVPDPVKHDRGLRMKFGVLVSAAMIQNGMSGAVYELAYRQKLQDLIERERYVPLPVILDRCFNSPHLAAGTARDIADALLNEIDELNAPLSRMKAWLAKKDDASLKALIHPHTLEAAAQASFREDDFKQELAALSLEEFFDLL
jgi:hypothetical protein